MLSPLSRRGFLISGAAAVTALRAMPATPSCVLTTEQDQGPFYVDDEKMRRDITEGKPGVPLKLKIALLHASKCAPLAGAAVDIWHCDAGGIYSGFTTFHPMGRGPGGPPPDGFGPPPNGFGPPPDGFGPPPEGFGPPPGMGKRKIDKTRFLRGVQTTDENGMVEFTTIYPGWYQGRAIHIHMKVHTGGHVSHTGQLFFPEDLNERIAKLNPYARHTDVKRTTQEKDMVFGMQHGAAGLMTLNRLTPGSDSAGFSSAITLAVDPEATPKAVGFGGPFGPR